MGWLFDWLVGWSFDWLVSWLFGWCVLFVIFCDFLFENAYFFRLNTPEIQSETLKFHSGQSNNKHGSQTLQTFEQRSIFSTNASSCALPHAHAHHARACRWQPGVVKFAHYAEALPQWIEHDYGNFSKAASEKLRRCLVEIGRSS